MVTRNHELAFGEYYHVYNRGVDKRTIFEVSSDYKRFVESLYLANLDTPTNVRDIKQTKDSVFEFEHDEKLVAIGAYCLMPNHFHVLLTPLQDGGVSKFMNKLATSYTMYFNKKYNRSGSLFQGPYKSSHADSDEYLKYLYAYIHLNPVKLIQSNWKETGVYDEGSAYDHAVSYQFSSLYDYCGSNREEVKVLNQSKFPIYFQSPAAHQAELFSWLTYAE